jgi:hypothetical protein
MNAAHGSPPSWAFRKEAVATVETSQPETRSLHAVVRGVLHCDPPPAPTLGSPAHRVHCRMRMVGSP